MKTKFLKSKEISKAAKIIKNSGLVAFPTETVYGLGGNALDKTSIKKIYKAKGRPSDNPLIVHIAYKKDLKKFVKEIPVEAKKLIKKFWPGPLTIILEKSNLIPKEITAGLNTVAIRLPSNKIARGLIKQSKVPIAAPSANLSGKPSTTNSKHVIQDLNGKIDAIILSKKSKFGLESTVVDLTTKPAMLLRPGSITLESLKKIIKITKYNLKENKIAKSPGMKYKHYAPDAKVILVNNISEKIIKKFKDKKIGVISKKEFKNVLSFKITDSKILAQKLFFLLRYFDDKKVDLILIEKVKERGIGLAIMNRIKKAALTEI